MITDEQARAALGEILETQTGRVRTVIEWARQELSRREQHDDGPITAEWCKENGFRYRDGSYLISAGNVTISVTTGRATYASVNRTEWRRNPTRRQLLALIAVLRGEQHTPRGQMNNIGPSR